MWDSEMVLLLRFVIDDVDEPVKYSDDKLQQLLLVAGQFVRTEVPLSQEYIIDVENYSITPDPTVTDHRDDSFINLTVLKAGCLLSTSPLIKSSGKNLRVKETTYEYDARGTLDSSKFAVQTFCSAYQDAKWGFATTNGVIGEVIIGPYKALIQRGHPWRYGFN
jgi:hypothetical protein